MPFACHACRQEELRGNPEDLDGGDEHGVQLIGVGHKIKHEQLDATCASAASFIQRLRPQGWTQGDIQAGCDDVRCYFQADLPHVGSVNSVGYSRPTNSISYYVLYRVVVGRGPTEREESRVAKVRSFLRLMASEQQADAEVLRLAVCDVYRPFKPVKDGAAFVIKEEGGLKHEHFALEVSGIEALLVSAAPARPPAVPGMPVKRSYNEGDLGKIFLTWFGNVSKMEGHL